MVIASTALADQYTSSSFKVLDPVLHEGGGFSSSSSFRLSTVLSQLGIGTSSGTLYGDNAGFLYYPFVTSPIVTATAGDAKVSLSWTSATAGVGWQVGGYAIGRSIVSGGPYSYTNVGNVLNSDVTGLTNGVTYYFVLQVKDGLGNVIATSSEVSSQPQAATSGGGTPPAGGGGGGGGPPPPPPSNGQSTVIFKGRAYPRSIVTLLKDAQVSVKTVSGDDANFSITLNNVNAGSFIFSVYGEDGQANRSNVLSFPVTIVDGATVEIGGIFLAPTISVDKEQVKKGDNIAIFGQSAASSDITIAVHSDEEVFSRTKSDKNGVYLVNFDTSVLELGDHTAQSKAALTGQISGYSQSVGFKVGNETIDREKKKTFLKGDLNDDGRVNLVDFSIGAYWYKRAFTPAFATVEQERLNGDGKVTLADFSIMAYYWTG